MTTGEPNKDKLVHFIAKIWDPVAEAYKPIYTAPDATDQTYGDVLLSDATDSSLNAESGVTAATPKAVKLVNDNANTKLSKTSTDPQEVVSKVIFKKEIIGEQNITAPIFTGDLKGNADTATKIKTPINLNTQSGTLTASGKVLFDGSSDVTIPIGELDATQLRGIIPLQNLPQGALERVVSYVSIQAAIDAYASATDDKPFQEGDTIRVTGTDENDIPVMYAVVGDPSLAKNYLEYAAATAAHTLSADQALKLTTDAGTASNPIYFKDGIPVASNSTIGAEGNPIYLKSGVVTPFTNTIGNANNPVYLSNGTIVPADFTVKTSVPENALFTDTIYEVFQGGTEDNPDGVNGLVPAPTLVELSSEDLFLKSDGSWAEVKSGVTGVKGNLETDYRVGDVNLTHHDIGALGLAIPEEDNSQERIQYMQGLNGQIDAPIKTTLGGLLANGNSCDLGDEEHTFRNVYANTLYADHIKLNEETLNDIALGDFTVANANKLNQLITFSGDVEGSVDLSSLGNKTVNLTVVNSSSEIAIQPDEPSDENIKLWIKI